MIKRIPINENALFSCKIVRYIKKYAERTYVDLTRALKRSKIMNSYLFVRKLKTGDNEVAKS
ncbi:TPA_asm: hypothetical protein GDN68_04650 [Listeria innocua]|nr:hypothetical protein [Listeria innocua]